jgi:non-haem Fe2+, alpha-ketoglutarate-dependent halogenase
MDTLVNNLLKKGIVKGQSDILSNNEIKELENLILKSKDEHLKKGEVVQNIVGIDKKIDELLEKILINPEIQNTLLKILGKNYFLRHISARYNEPNDEGLALHQDSNGEVCLMVLLNDQLDGSTFFFPGTQLIPSNKHTATKVSWNSLRLIKITNYFLMLANGKAGNYYYFLNRTWHGRTPGKSNKTKLSLFFDFFPVSAKRKDLSKGEFIYNSNVKYESVTQPNLNKILSKKNYYSAIEVFEKTNDNNYSLSMKVSSYNTMLKNKFYFTYTILKLIFLEILFSPISLKRFFKNLIS